MLPPIQADARVDLHVHSSRSDGRLDPEAILERAFEARLSVLAVTDHDLPAPFECDHVERDGRRLRILAGSEITTQHEGLEQHLLAYVPASMSPSLRGWLSSLATLRNERFARAGQRLGLPEGWMGIAPEGGRAAVTRPHLARACVRAGLASCPEDAWRRLLHFEAGFLEPAELGFHEALERCLAEGAFTSWAHPDPECCPRWIRGFASRGLHALEALRPGLGRRQRMKLRSLAEHHGLLVTGGSDWHGYRGEPLGFFAAPLSLLRPFFSSLDDGGAKR